MSTKPQERQVASVFDLIQEHQVAVQQGHQTCSLDCQRRLQLGWYDCTTKVWVYATLTVVKDVGLDEKNRPWKQLGFPTFSKVKAMLRDVKSRSLFFGTPIPEIVNERDCSPPKTPEELLASLAPFMERAFGKSWKK